MDAYGPLGVEVIMQDCHSCDPGSIPGAGASLISLMNCHCATHSAPDFDPSIRGVAPAMSMLAPHWHWTTLRMNVPTLRRS